MLRVGRRGAASGGGGFGRVGEPVQLGQPEGAITGLDVPEYAAGTDGGQLLIIPDQPDTRSTADRELDSRVKGEGVGHPGFVNDDQGRQPDRVAQSGSSP